MTELGVAGTSRAAKSCLDVIELPYMELALFHEHVFEAWLTVMNAELSPLKEGTLDGALRRQRWHNSARECRRLLMTTHQSYDRFHA
jgi:hypothetical protein